MQSRVQVLPARPDHFRLRSKSDEQLLVDFSKNPLKCLKTLSDRYLKKRMDKGMTGFGRFIRAAQVSASECSGLGRLRRECRI